MAHDYQAELLSLAQRVAADYAAHPQVEAILLTGSVAQSTTDVNSDIDLILSYAALPTPEEMATLQAAAHASGGNIYGYDPEEGLACYHFIDDVKVDFAHQRTAETTQRIADFLADPAAADTTSHIVLSGIVQGKALYGAKLIETWQRQLSDLPSTFGETLIKANLRVPPIAVLQEMGAGRRDYALVYEILLESVKRLANIWCGLNNMIPPGKLKSLERLEARLPIAPPQLTKRLRYLWVLPPDEAIDLFYQLVDETFSLVEQHLPGLDTTSARQRLTIPLHLRR
ncbi:MAG TPA: hypothetical protein P5121_02610 [Caldilineaceae bacterium]|nr:hypothetical protein [Caldilineaceae bacterium]